MVDCWQRPESFSLSSCYYSSTFLSSSASSITATSTKSTALSEPLKSLSRPLHFAGERVGTLVIEPVEEEEEDEEAAAAAWRRLVEACPRVLCGDVIEPPPATTTGGVFRAHLRSAGLCQHRLMSHAISVPLCQQWQLILDGWSGVFVNVRLVPRKLAIVLDLDHTLVHAATDVDERTVRRYRWFAPDDTHVLEVKHPLATSTTPITSDTLPSSSLSNNADKLAADVWTSTAFSAWPMSSAALPVLADSSGAIDNDDDDDDDDATAVQVVPIDSNDDDDDDAQVRVETMVISVRPGTRRLMQWLSTVTESVDVVVCSAGVRAYVDAVVQLLDPQRLIVRHVVSRENLQAGSVPSSPAQLLSFLSAPPAVAAAAAAARTTSCIKDLRCLGVPVHVASAVVLDDRPDVWVQHHNVMRVEPYVAFENDADACQRAVEACVATGRAGACHVSDLDAALLKLQQYVEKWQVATEPHSWSLADFSAAAAAAATATPLTSVSALTLPTCASSSSSSVSVSALSWSPSLLPPASPTVGASGLFRGLLDDVDDDVLFAASSASAAKTLCGGTCGGAGDEDGCLYAPPSHLLCDTFTASAATLSYSFLPQTLPLPSSQPTHTQPLSWSSPFSSSSSVSSSSAVLASPLSVNPWLLLPPVGAS